MGDTTADALQELFASPTRRTPAEVAEHMAAVFRAIRGMPDKVRCVNRVTERLIGAAGDPALAAASRALADAIDANAAVYDRHPYHSRQHYCEVTLAVGLLCKVHDLADRDAQLVLLAALVHDLAHDGHPSRDFRLERQSIDHALPYLKRAGVAEDACGRLAALVLATQPIEGLRYALGVRSFHAGGVDPPAPPEGAPELASLSQHEGLARLALLLCEADILPSVGLTFAHAMQLQDLLAHEWGRALSHEDKLIFLEGVLASGVVGSFFLPNALAIRKTVIERVHDSREG